MSGDKKSDDIDHRYGFCPKCSIGVYMRERRPNGNDICANGHTFPSKDTLKALPKKK